ncbi:MAG TPA: hypothetical protein VJL33_07520 [Candidatus Bathyarchaeia archaeon]|nr:hypothetical protein [Candidatus Bathyarchaeia archaeon]
MTKHVTPEEALKCPLGLDEAGKVGEGVNKLLETNALVIGDAQVSLVQDSKLKIPLVKARKTVKKSRLGKITEKLYNLEPCNLPEKPLNVDLGLYQMEDY